MATKAVQVNRAEPLEDDSAPERPRSPTTVSADFRELFDAELTYVCRSLRRLGVREADLEDVAQEVFVSVHRRFAELDPELPVRPWLFSFALRSAANYRRLARHRRERVDGEAGDREATSDRSPERAVQRRQASETVQQALEQLSYDRRVVLVMHDIEGFSAPEIAEETGAPLNTVYSRLRHARARFVEAVRKQGGAP